MNYIFVELKATIDGHPEGQTVRIPIDKKGNALSSFWRKRIKDSETDKCLKVLKKEPKKGFVNA